MQKRISRTNSPDEQPALEVPRRVTFDATTKPPQIDEPVHTTPSPRVTQPSECTRPEPIHKVTIDKAILNAPTPRVEKAKSTPTSNGRRSGST